VTDTSIKIGDAWRFFLPLVFMTELNMISKSVIHAFLARTPDPSTTLAAFNTSFTFYYTVTGCTEITVLLAIAWLKGRGNLRPIAGFLVLLLSLPLALVFAVAFTPLGAWLYGEVFGLGAQATSEAKEASYIFVVSAPILIMRGFAFALLMTSRNTLLITLSTFVRLIVLSISLLIWPIFLSGAAIGAAALVSCMFAETVFAWAYAGRFFFALPARAAERAGVREMWRFSWPLVINQSSEMGVVFTVNLFLGQLAKAELALAAFGVVHGLVSLLMSPMRNLAQTGQTLASSRADVQVLMRFSLQLAAAFALLALVLFWTPMEIVILDHIMGLTEELSAYSEPAMRAAFAMALFWAFAALYRGLLAGARSTRMLAVTAALKLGAAALAGAAVLAVPQVNGAVLGLSAWILAYAVEVAVLRPMAGRAWTDK
jgi:Na+-driven multidrug efflux pump